MNRIVLWHKVSPALDNTLAVSSVLIAIPVGYGLVIPVAGLVLHHRYLMSTVEAYCETWLTKCTDKMMHQVLFIDDNRSEMTSFMENVKDINSGVKCTYANNGKQALDLLRHMLPSYIFIRFNAAALELLSAIRFERRLKSTRIYLYADQVDDEMSKKAQLLGASGCIEKDPSVSGMIHKYRALFSPELLPDYALIKYNCPGEIFVDKAPDLMSLETDPGLEEQADENT